jgi:hypothetical protein
VATRDYDAIFRREANDAWLGQPENVETIVGHCRFCGGGLTSWDRLSFPGEKFKCPYHHCRIESRWDDVV